MEDYVSYEQAVKLKELGFDWECVGYYTCLGNFGIDHLMPYTLDSKTICDNYNDNTISQTYNVEFSAPTLAQAQKWLGRVKETEVIVNRLDENVYGYMIYGELVNVSSKTHFNFYEQALSAGINSALELLNS